MKQQAKRSVLLQTYERERERERERHTHTHTHTHTFRADPAFLMRRGSR